MSFPDPNIGIGGLQIEDDDMAPNAQINLASPPYVEKLIRGGIDITLSPYGGLSAEGPHEFHINSMSNYYTDLTSARLYGKIKITTRLCCNDASIFIISGWLK